MSNHAAVRRSIVGGVGAVVVHLAETYSLGRDEGQEEGEREEREKGKGKRSHLI